MNLESLQFHQKLRGDLEPAHPEQNVRRFIRTRRRRTRGFARLLAHLSPFDAASRWSFGTLCSGRTVSRRFNNVRRGFMERSGERA